MNEQFIQKLKESKTFFGDIKTEEPLSTKTTFKIGGKANLFIEPQNIQSFQMVFSELISQNKNFFILGGGSNVVFPDTNFSPSIISTQAFTHIEITNQQQLPKNFESEPLSENQILVTCNSGTSMASFVNFCTSNNLSGAEQFAGLPGSIGGALFMNARCFEKSISDILYSYSYLDYTTQDISIIQSKLNQNEWNYKKSPFQHKKQFIATATFLLTKVEQSEQEKIKNLCTYYINERVSKGHFKYPSAGSVFKNNHSFGKPSGKIIDEAGLRGYQIGGAQIAPFHGNFIININNASSKDVKSLVEYIQNIIYEKFKFKLEPEIIFVDNQDV